MKTLQEHANRARMKGLSDSKIMDVTETGSAALHNMIDEHAKEIQALKDDIEILKKRK